MADKRYKRIWFTATEAPYPDHDYGRAVLRLTLHDALAWKSRLPLRNMSTTVKRDVTAAARRAAPRRATFRLDPRLQSMCIWRRQFREGGLRGELGILDPKHVEHRGIEVLHNGRPLCEWPEAPGWPFCAIVDGDSIEPNRYFDGTKTLKMRANLVSKLRELVDATLAESMQPPQGALASRWINDRGEDGTIMGRLWLMPGVPLAPAVFVRAPQLLPGPNSVVLRRLFGPPGIDNVIPVDGTFLVLPASASVDLHQVLAKRALDAAADMAQECLDGGKPLSGATRWSLGLLNAEVEPPPRAPTADGGKVGPKDVVAELERTQQIWTTEKRGTADGLFPDEAPAFVLLAGEQTGLIDLLQLRGKGVLRELGGLTVSTPPEPANQPVLPNGEFFEAPPTEVPWVEPEDEEELVESWFAGLKRKVVNAVASRPAEAPVSRSLAQTIHAAIEELQLDAEVADVRFSRSGRPLRWNRNGAMFVVNRDHPSIRALLPPNQEPEREALRLLAAAVASELNRALEAVTASGEMAALLRMLGPANG